MATITFSIQTDSNVVSGSQSVNFPDQAVIDFMTAMSAQMPGANTIQLFTAWIENSMNQTVGLVQSYQQSLIVLPEPYIFTVNNNVANS